MQRPMAVIAVFALEVWLLFHYQSEIKEFATSVNQLELFKGLGTLLFPAPIAFLLWYWRDADKQRELHRDGVRLQNENDKLILEKRILEGDAAVAREKIDKANLETQVAKLEADLESEKTRATVLRREIAGADSAQRRLNDDDILSILKFLAPHFPDGKPRPDTDPLALSVKTLFLSQIGQTVLKEWCERNAYFEPHVLDVFSDEELPEFRLPPLASR